MNLGNLQVQIGVNAEPLKQGLSGAKAAVLTWAQEVKISEQHLAALTQQMAKETAAAQQETAAKRQAAAIERELLGAKAQLTAVLAEESAAAQQVAAKYSLLTAAQREQLVSVREQITAQRALQEAQLQSGLAAEKAAAAESAAAAKAAAAVEAATAQKVAAAQKNLGQNLQKIGGGLTGAVTTPLLGIGAAAIAGQVALQGVDVQIAQASGATGKQLQQLDAIARQVGVSVPNSWKEISTAVSDLFVRTGQTGQALEKLAVSELNLGRITGEGTNVIKATTQAFAAWNVAADQQIPTLDMLEKAHQLTGIGVTKLSENLARFAPTLKQWGLGITESTALLSGFEKERIPVERMMAGLAQGLARLAKAGITDAHQALGIIIKDLSDTQHPMAAMAEATRLFGARIGTQLVGAIQSGKFSLTELQKKLEDSGGAIDKTAKQTETFFTALNKFGHQAAVAVAPLGKILLDMATQFLQSAKPIIDWLAKAVEWFSKLSPSTKQTIVDFALLAAALGPVVTWIGKALAGFQLVKEALLGIRLAVLAIDFAVLLNPITLVIAALVALAAAFYINFGGIRDYFVTGVRVMIGMLHGLSLAEAEQAAVEAGRPNAQRGEIQIGENRGSLNRVKAAQDAAAAAKANAARQASESAADIRDKLAGIGAPKAKETPLEKEQTRYTEELTQAHAKLAELLSGEDKIAGQVAARYHLLTSAQRDNLTGVLEQIKKQEELQHSQEQFTKDMTKVNAEIRRLAAGHKAEGSSLDELKEKYPGLSRAQLTAMNNAIQWKNHLQELRAEAVRVAEAFRGMTKGYLEATAQSNVERAAVSLFGEPELKRRGRILSARDLYQGLNPRQQQEAQAGGMVQAETQLGGSIEKMKERLASLNYVTRTNQISMEAFGKTAEHLSDQNQVLVTSYENLENALQRAEARDQLLRAEQQKYNAVIGSAGVQLSQLQDQFAGLTDKSAIARKVMAQFGVNLRELPKDTQASLRGIIQLQERLSFFQDIAQGTQQVFEGMFQNLYQHGFKGFFANVIQGFEGMLQQMAARYLASKLADLVTGLIGGFFGGGGGGISDASIVGGLASGGKVTAGRPYFVGEQGRELFVPPSNGQIVPNAQLAGAGGGAVNVTFNISTPDVGGFRANQKALMSDALRHAQSIQRRNG